MFDVNSRYAKSQVVDVASTSSKKVAHAVVLRRLPYAEGNLTEVSGRDRLDITEIGRAHV